MNQIPIFLKVTIPLTTAYEDDEMKLGDVNGQLVFRLFGNAGEAMAEAVAGVWKQTGLSITARLHVPYTFRMPEGVLELCGNDLAAKDAFSLFLCDADDRNRVCLRPHEVRCNSLRGEQSAPLQKTLRSVWGYIKKACLDNGVSVRTKNPQPKALEHLYAIYENRVLRGIYDPDLDKFNPDGKDGVSLRPLTSVVPGTFTLLAPGTNVLNVIGSALDTPKTTTLAPYANCWRRAWELATNTYNSNFCACAVPNNVAWPPGVVGHTCTTGLWAFVGGHMLSGALGITMQNIAPGGTCILFPVCQCVNRHPNVQFQVMQPNGVNAVDLWNFLS